MPIGNEYGCGRLSSEQSHDRLQHGGDELRGERDQPDLEENEVIVILQQRVDGGQERLDQVVEKMADADGAEDGVGGAVLGSALRRSLRSSLQRRGRRGAHTIFRISLPGPFPQSSRDTHTGGCGKMGQTAIFALRWHTESIVCGSEKGVCPYFPRFSGTLSQTGATRSTSGSTESAATSWMCW